jgi:hypothetical protein
MEQSSPAVLGPVESSVRPLSADDWKFVFDVMTGTKLDVPRIRADVARLIYEQAKSERRAIVFGDIVHTQTLAMRAAVVDAKLNGPDAGMAWIENTLCGPGHLPDVEAAKSEGGAQCMFNREMAEHEAFRAAHPAP